MVIVARVWRRGENVPLQSKYVSIYMANIGKQEILIVYRWKMKWKLPPGILVTRNRNWSQKSGTGTDCVKGRY